MLRLQQLHNRIRRMGFAVRVRSAGQKYGPTCHQRDRADVTEFVTLVRLSSLGQHVDVLALAGYKRRKSALTAGHIALRCHKCTPICDIYEKLHWRCCQTRSHMSCVMAAKCLMSLVPRYLDSVFKFVHETHGVPDESS